MWNCPFLVLVLNNILRQNCNWKGEQSKDEMRYLRFTDYSKHYQQIILENHRFKSFDATKNASKILYIKIPKTKKCLYLLT